MFHFNWSSISYRHKLVLLFLLWIYSTLYTVLIYAWNYRRVQFKTYRMSSLFVRFCFTCHKFCSLSKFSLAIIFNNLSKEKSKRKKILFRNIGTESANRPCSIRKEWNDSDDREKSIYHKQRSLFIYHKQRKKFFGGK